MGQQIDPQRSDLRPRWVFSDTKDVLCTSTDIVFGGFISGPLSAGSEQVLYHDEDQLSLINNANIAKLRENLQCADVQGKHHCQTEGGTHNWRRCIKF